MERKLIAWCVLFIVSRFAEAQSPTFTYNSTAYSPLSAATHIYVDSIWDDMNYSTNINKFNLGFNFKWKGYSFDSVEILDGLINFSDTDGNSLLFGSFVDLIDRGALGSSQSKSPIFIKKSGTSPNAKLEIEWRNVGFFDEIDFNNSLADSATFTISIQEQNSILELHFGNSGFSSNPPLYLEQIACGAIENIGVSQEIYFTEGISSYPTITSDINTIGMDQMPGNGQKYTFKFTQQADANFVNVSNNLFYNSGYIFNKKRSISDIEIYSMTGHLLEKGKFNAYHYKHKHLNTGFYIAVVRSNDSYQTLEFFVP